MGGCQGGPMVECLVSMHVTLASAQQTVSHGGVCLYLST